MKRGKRGHTTEKGMASWRWWSSMVGNFVKHKMNVSEASGEECEYEK